MQRENRRLAAIVAADVAGYSRLIGRNAVRRGCRRHRVDTRDPGTYTRRDKIEH